MAADHRPGPGRTAARGQWPGAGHQGCGTWTWAAQTQSLPAACSHAAVRHRRHALTRTDWCCAAGASPGCDCGCGIGGDRTGRRWVTSSLRAGDRPAPSPGCSAARCRACRQAMKATCEPLLRFCRACRHCGCLAAAALLLRPVAGLPPCAVCMRTSRPQVRWQRGSDAERGRHAPGQRHIRQELW